MDESYLRAIAARYPQLANNLAMRMGGGRFASAPRGMPMVRGAPFQTPVREGTGFRSGAMASQEAPPAAPSPAPDAVGPAYPAPPKQVGATPPHDFGFPQPLTTATQAPEGVQGLMPPWAQQGGAPSAQQPQPMMWANPYAFTQPAPLQAMQGQPGAQGQPQGLMPPNAGAGVNTGNSGFTGGIGGLPFGSNMQRR